MPHGTVSKLEGYLVSANQKKSTMQTLLTLKITTSNHTPAETQLQLEMGLLNESESQSKNLGEFLAILFPQHQNCLFLMSIQNHTNH